MHICSLDLLERAGCECYVTLLSTIKRYLTHLQDFKKMKGNSIRLMSTIILKVLFKK